MKNKRSMLSLTLITFSTYLLINCTTIQIDNFSQVVGKEWKVVSISGKQLNSADLENGLPRITFNKDNKLLGFTGCNTFYGNYQVENSQITLDPGILTKMMCNDNTEMRLLSAFDEINEWKFIEDKLELLNKEKVVLILVLADK